MATNPRQAERELSDLGQDTRKVADRAGQSGRTIADAAQRTTRTGAETLQRNLESGAELWQHGADAANRIARRPMEELSKLFGFNGETARETVQQTSDNMQAVIASTSTIAGGLQNVASEWMQFVQTRIEQNLDHLNQLRECRNLQDCVALKRK